MYKHFEGWMQSVDYVLTPVSCNVFA